MSDQFEDRIFRNCINDFYRTIVGTAEGGWPVEYNLRDFFIEMAEGKDGIETSLLTMAKSIISFRVVKSHANTNI